MIRPDSIEDAATEPSFETGGNANPKTEDENISVEENVLCPHCGSGVSTHRLVREDEIGLTERHQCASCSRDFTHTTSTDVQG